MLTFDLKQFKQFATSSAGAIQFQFAFGVAQLHQFFALCNTVGLPACPID